MGTDARQLHLLFFPLMAPGHLIPMVDIAKLFACRGVRASILTTPSNAPAVAASLRRDMEYGHPVEILLIEFPPSETGLLPGNVASATSGDMHMELIVATARFRGPFERLCREHRPDAIVTDMFYPWTGAVAEEFGVPRLVFHGTCFFSLCVGDAVYRHLWKAISPPENGDGGFVVPGLPHRIELSRSQVPDVRCMRPDFAQVLIRMKEADEFCYGAVVNSFYEMERDYADHYRKVLGRKAWHVGPVSLCNEDAVDKAARGGSTAGDPSSFLSWLGSKAPGSVVYVCFGSLGRLTDAQMRELALGLEVSGHNFMWVVRDGAGRGDPSEKWLPEGFEERTAGSGMVIRGWAPQVLLLNHEAIGGFVTHCGWNSCLEGITAGVPLATWPLFADQFNNEKLLVEVLRVGVPVSAEKHYSLQEEERPLVRAEEVAKAVGLVMGGREEGVEMRRRARKLKEAARRAVAEGGSSYDDMGRLIESLLEKKAAVPCHG